MDVESVGPDGQEHLVVLRCRDHGVRFGWSRFGLGISHPLAIVYHISFESFVGGWSVRRGIIKVKAYPSAIISRFYGLEPRVTYGKSFCCMKVMYQGINAD